MKKNIAYGVLALVLAVFMGLTACHSAGETKKDSGENVDLVAPKDAATQHETKQDSEEKQEKADAVDVAKISQPVYPEFKDLPAPESLTNSKDEEIGRSIITSDDKEDACVAQLQKEGYRQTRDSRTYVKDVDNRVMIVQFTGGEGELDIAMYATHDPMERYAKIPDARIPYPFDNSELAAEYANFKVDSENEVTYTYYNRNAAFVDDYDQRLRAEGFNKSENGAKTIYRKNASSKVLSVEIEKTNDRGTDMLIHIRAEESK